MGIYKIFHFTTDDPELNTIKDVERELDNILSIVNKEDEYIVVKEGEVYCKGKYFKKIKNIRNMKEVSRK
jgi:hypothetical protein